MAPWYLEFDPPEALSRFLDEIRLGREDYERAMNEVARLCPPEVGEARVRRLLEEEGFLGEFSLHPSPHRRLVRHPLPLLMSGFGRTAPTLCELLRLGLDLRAVKHLEGIRAVMKRLSDTQDVENVIGTLFEIEVLSFLVRAETQPELMGTPDARATVDGKRVSIEILHRGAPAWRVVTAQIVAGLAFLSFGEVTVKLEPGIGGPGKQLEMFATNLVSHIRSVVESRDGDTVTHGSGPNYSFQHDPLGPARSLDIKFKEESYADLLEGLAYGILRDKDEKQGQLRQAHASGDTCLFAVDVRPLLPAVPALSGNGYLESIRRRLMPERKAIIKGLRRFMDEADLLDGVLLWSRKSPLQIGLRELLHDPWQVSLICRDEEIPVTVDGLSGALGGILKR